MPTYRYHWTHRHNLGSIMSEGLDPRRSHGALALVWSVEDERVEWARSHVAERHGWALRDMVLLRIDTTGLPHRGRAAVGVANTPIAISPRRLSVYLGTRGNGGRRVATALTEV